VKDAERPIRVLGGDSDQTFPVAAVAHVVDATGAGDALAAGFLVRYAERQPIDECISAGRALAARVVTLAGATLEGE
jgi:sugar/nucleoside kinase (ribokinase family)